MLALREMLDRLAAPSNPSYSTGLFTDVWNPKGSPVRHRTLTPSFFGLGYSTATGYSANLGLSTVTPKLTLAGQTLAFHGGHWVDEPTILQNSLATSRGSSKERLNANSRVRSLKKKVQNLEEENNGLKVRVEMLLDMLADTTAELWVFKYTLQDTEEALAKCLKKKQNISQ